MTSTEIDATALRARFFAELPDPLRSAVNAVVREGESSGVYLAAGVVRDLLLARRFVDVDLVTLQDALTIALRVAGGSATVHERFRTATIDIGGYRLDLATARTETYAHPGALPEVARASIEEDMRRRDFSMNAVALRLSGDPTIIDPCGGIADVLGKLVRVLHDASFRDDATRIFRAIRYAARLGFAIEPHTHELMRDGVRFIETISGERLRHELHLLFGEETGGVALEGLNSIGALSAIHPSLRWTPRATKAMDEAGTRTGERVPAGFALLSASASHVESARIAERLQLSREEAAVIRAMPSLNQSSAMLVRPDAKPSGIVAVLDRFPSPAIAAYGLLSTHEVLAEVVRRYLAEWRHQRPLLTGNDLREMGIPEGPEIGKGLQLIRAARLDGWANDRDDERALALRFAKSIRDSRAMNQPIDFYQNGN